MRDSCGLLGILWDSGGFLRIVWDSSGFYGILVNCAGLLVIVWDLWILVDCGGFSWIVG